MHENDNPHLSAKVLFLYGGIAYFLGSFILNRHFFLYLLLDSDPTLTQITSNSCEKIQTFFIFTGTILIFIYFLKEVLALESFFKSSLITNLLLIPIAYLIPISIIEISTKDISKYLDNYRSIYVRDIKLGWKHKPSTKGVAFFTWVEINSNKLRGPEISYKKPKDTYRILFLGDSVTFGHLVHNYKEVFPHMVEKILFDKTKKKIEAINAGVNGYSPWQEYLYLKEEGIKFNPNLVVVGFVLNDVTEQLRLLKFGGFDEGDALLIYPPSGLIEDFLCKSNIVKILKHYIERKVVFKDDPARAAKIQEVYDIKSFTSNPYHPKYKKGWDISLDNLKKLFALCQERNINVIFVIFPYKFQLHEINKRQTVQEILTKFASDNDIPVVDLLPIYTTHKEHKEKSLSYFFDESHLTIEGHKATAEIISDYILDKKLI